MSKDESQEHDAAEHDETSEAEAAPKTDEERRQLHRKLIKGAAALAAAAIGGGLIADSADAQTRRSLTALRPNAAAGRSALAQSVRGDELANTLRNIPAVMADMKDPGPVLQDVQKWLTPVIDRAGGQVSSIGINVASSITVNG